MSFCVFLEPLYQICEVYIDDLLIYGNDDQNFVTNVCTIFQKCREKKKSKKVLWKPQADSDFVTLKSLVNQCPKLYFLNTELPIILYTDASDYAHG